MKCITRKGILCLRLVETRDAIVAIGQSSEIATIDIPNVAQHRSAKDAYARVLNQTELNSVCRR